MGAKPPLTEPLRVIDPAKTVIHLLSPSVSVTIYEDGCVYITDGGEGTQVVLSPLEAKELCDWLPGKVI
jgi:hypothetical protein